MSEPGLFLQALTPEATASLGAGRIRLERLPFRVGRESRLVAGEDGLRVAERRKSGGAPNNELYLVDAGPRLQVSRNHFLIEADSDGGYRLIDRSSACGTLVGSQQIGGRDEGGSCPLRPGDVIVVGNSASPFVFRFERERDLG